MVQDDYFDVDNINAKDFQDIYQNLGYHLATSKHDESLSYRNDLNPDFALLMMDSNAHEQTEMTLGGKWIFYRFNYAMVRKAASGYSKRWKNATRCDAS